MNDSKPLGDIELALLITAFVLGWLAVAGFSLSAYAASMGIHSWFVDAASGFVAVLAVVCVTFAGEL